jgi:hypothetical protein
MQTECNERDFQNYHKTTNQVHQKIGKTFEEMTGDRAGMG